jgi:hypothetical protein
LNTRSAGPAAAAKATYVKLPALFEAKRAPFKHPVHAPTLTSQESVDARLVGG